VTLSVILFLIQDYLSLSFQFWNSIWCFKSIDELRPDVSWNLILNWIDKRLHNCYTSHLGSICSQRNRHLNLIRFSIVVSVMILNSKLWSSNSCIVFFGIVELTGLEILGAFDDFLEGLSRTKGKYSFVSIHIYHQFIQMLHFRLLVKYLGVDPIIVSLGDDEER